MRTAIVVVSLSLAAVLPGCGVGQLEETSGSTGQPATAALSADGAYLRQTLTEGAQFHASNGIQVGADGRLYVASVLGRNISVVDRHSGTVLDRLGTDRGVESPDDLVFGPDGSLYWTSFFTGEVGRLTPQGEKLTVAQLAPGVNAITFSSDSGRLFVTRVFLGDELYELDPDGVVAPRLIRSGMGGLNGMDFGPDGHLYGPLWFRGEIARIDVDTGDLAVVASGFATPAAVKFDSQGRLHVADQARGQVVRIEADGSKTLVAQLPVTGIDNLAFDATDRLFVTNSHDGSLNEILPTGGGRELSPAGLVAPGGLAVLRGASGNEVYVPDSLSMKVFDGHTGMQLRSYEAIIGVTPLATPLTASADGQHLILTSWFANVVQRFDPGTGTVLETHRDFARPIDAVRFGGDLVVTELATGTVSRKDAAGIKTIIASGLLVPAGLAVWGGDLFLTEWIRGRVLQLAEAGQMLESPRVVASGLSRPEGITADADGSLLVVETGLRRLLRLDPTSGLVSVVDDGLDLGLVAMSGAAPTFIFNGVTVGGCGAIYVTLDVANQLVRLSPLGAGTPACPQP